MLSKNSEYAIRALIFIQIRNWDDRRPGVREIASGIEAPEAYMAKILQTLTRRNVVRSRKGRGGGFFFGDGQNLTSLYDIVYIMEGDACFTKCAFGFSNCSDKAPCPLHHKYVKVRENMLDIVKSESIESISRRIVDGKAVLKQGGIKTVP